MIQSVTNTIDRARSHHLEAVADRLLELVAIPVDDDELPLHPVAAQNFVEYCIVRGKHGMRPLMSITPCGDFDATWRGPDGERIAMRFFEDNKVWIARKGDGASISFETTIADLCADNQMPDWA